MISQTSESTPGSGDNQNLLAELEANVSLWQHDDSLRQQRNGNFLTVSAVLLGSLGAAAGLQAPPVYLAGLAVAISVFGALICRVWGLVQVRNADTVLEKALHGACILWHYRHVPTTIERQPAGIRVLKPHGSLNWRFQGNQPSVEINTDYSLEPVVCHSYEDNRFEEALIVPPTQIKQAITVDETQAPETTILFRNLWQDMTETLAVASRVFVIGYSFPPTDLHLRTMFHLVLRRRAFEPFDEVSCCTRGDGQEGAVFANTVQLLPAKSFRLHAGGFQAFVGCA